ncbi:MAG: site-specific DNA-methyltransferase [Elusimicrobiota bacterium]|jgi:site-specific DNA-methyltransferase (adenine-specific)|nr:site-specific DNA-methyltransferase [Elusimicrobiota bacterium]
MEYINTNLTLLKKQENKSYMKVEGLLNKVHCANALSFLQRMPCDSVDLIITSPPYFQQRKYGAGGIGNETTEEEYIDNLISIFNECPRIIKPTGAIVFNLGDKYLNGNLSLIPYKFAIKASENKNVFLINQITWAKTNPTPRQEHRKLIQSTEPFFIFAKTKNYHFNLDEYLSHLDRKNKKTNLSFSKAGSKYFDIINQSDLKDEEKENAKCELEKVITEVQLGKIESFRMKIRGIHKEAYGGMDGGRNNQIRKNGFTIIKITGNAMKKDLIESPVEATKGNKHIAVYPLYIIQELVKLLSNRGDIVLDPFCGSGTTCIAAKNLERNYLGIEINPEYVSLSEERINETDISCAEFLL